MDHNSKQSNRDWEVLELIYTFDADSDGDEDMFGVVKDENHGADPVQVPIGPVTRTRAKRFKEGLNKLIQERVRRHLSRSLSS